MKTRLLNSILMASGILASTVLLNGCITKQMIDKTGQDSDIITHTEVLNEDFIAIGYPSEPIKGFENAILLAGKNYSFLVQPIVSDKNPSNILKEIFTNVDLDHLYINTLSYFGSNVSKTQASSKILYLNVRGNNTKYIKNVRAKTGLIFAKPIKDMSVDEQSYIESLDFTCDTVDIKGQDNLVCERLIPTALTLASPVQNINNIEHKLKQPLNIVVNYRENKPGKRHDLARVGLMPITIVADIITLPVQAVGAAMVLGYVYVGYSNH